MLALGPDGNLYVASGNPPDPFVLRYSGTTGMPLPSPGNTGAVFSTGGGLVLPLGIAFGPDGNLYVSDYGPANGSFPSIRRYNGTTGTFMNVFASGGGLTIPAGIVFGPDRNLYVSNDHSNSILRFNGTSGLPMPSAGNTGATFVPASSGGLIRPQGLVFGSDGRLYVASYLNGRILRFDGSTGAFVDIFASTNLVQPIGLVFGPDGNMYVSDIVQEDVVRFNGATGAFIDHFVPTANNGGLSEATYLIFTPGDPVELFQTPLYDDPSLVAYYRMEGNANDSKGSINGTATSVTYGTSYGRFGQGSNFAAPDSSISFGNNFNVGNRPFTVVGWINMKTVSNRVIFGKKGDGHDVSPGWALYWQDRVGGTQTALGVNVSNGATGELPYGHNYDTSALAGAWHHVAVVRGTNFWKVYLDGLDDTEGGGTSNSLDLDNTAAFFIGGNSGFAASNATFDGSIDDVAFFDRALTAAEINSLYTGAPFTGITFDALAQFDMVHNPSPSGWSYGSMAKLAGPFALFAFGGSNPPWFDWSPARGVWYPDVENSGGLSLGELSHDVAVVRWTSTLTGTAYINAAFTGYWTGSPQAPTQAGVHVLVNGVSIFDQAIYGGAKATFTTSSPIVVHPGDRIDFALGDDPNGNNTDDRVILGAQIKVFNSEASADTITVTTNLPSATFTITGPATYSGSGTSFAQPNASPGTYTLTFHNVAEYITPPSQTLTLIADGTLKFNEGIYTPITIGACPTNSIRCGPTMTFNYQQGFVGPVQPQQVQVTSNGPAITFKAAVATTPAGGTWLSITTSGGTTPDNFAVNVAPNLAAGTYTGKISITSAGATNVPRPIVVTLNVIAPVANPVELFSTPFYNDPSLVAYYRMEGNANDSKGSNNGAPSAVAFSSSDGKFGQGADFNGSISIITVPETATLKPANITLHVWLHLNGTVGPGNYPIIIDRANAHASTAGFFDGYQLFINGNTGKIQGRVFTPATVGGDFNTVPVAGRWYMIDLTYDGITLKCYVNGVQEPTTYTGSHSIAYTSKINLGMGARTTGTTSYLSGWLDDAAIFSRALTATEVAILYGTKAEGHIVATTNLTSATFTVTGPATFSGVGTSFTEPNAPAGKYTLTFHPVANYITPPSQTLDLVAGGTITFNEGIYTPITSACVSPSRPVPDKVTLKFGAVVKWATSPHNGTDYTSPLSNPIANIGPGGTIDTYTKTTASGFGAIPPQPSGNGPAIWVKYLLGSGAPVYVLYGHTASSWDDQSTGSGSTFTFNATYTINWKTGEAVGFPTTIGLTAPYYLYGLPAPHLHISVFVPNKSCSSGTAYCRPPTNGWGYSQSTFTTGQYVDPETFWGNQAYCLKP